jgi:hypothetical protein
MRVRHRTPSIFSISMVDVLCCALGCMILMWITKSDEYEKAVADNKDAFELKTRLDRSEAEQKRLRALLAQLDIEKSGTRKKIDDLEAKLVSLNSAKAAVDRLLTEQKKKLEELLRQLAFAEEENAELAGAGSGARLRVDDLEKRAEELARKLRAADASVSRLEQMTKEIPNLKEKLSTEEKAALLLKADRDRRLRELAEAREQYEALRKAKLTLESDLDGKKKELLSALAYKNRLDDSEKKRQQLEDLLSQRGRDLREATQSADQLKEEKRKLQDEATRIRVAAEQRFAGIELRGKRVMFLVDMSGSMDLVDEKTPAPTKWGDVRHAVARVMRSLPDLEKFQVLIFAEDVQYLLGKDGEWIDYDPKTSPDRVLDALARIKPKGGTNMQKVLEKSFTYREKGLDTIYLFSDGLPNEGEGLTPEQDKTITDQTQRSNLLGKYIRRKLDNDWNRSIRGKDRVRINAVGFFFESPDVGAFLWALARENDGSFVGMSRP